MWLFTPRGFYSVVAHRKDADKLLVRARVRADLEALREQIPHLRIFSDRHADYRWRAVVTRGEWAMALALLVDDLDYDNFKSAVGERQGHERARLYGHVWGEHRESFDRAPQAVTEEVAKVLLEKNWALRIGTLGIDEDGEITVDHCLMGESLSKDELAQVLRLMSGIAGDLDDELTMRFS